LVFLPDFFTLLLILVTPLATGSLALYCLNRTAPLVLVPAADKDSAAIRRLTLHACVSALFFGLVAGFLDVLSGYRILTVGELYDSVLLLLAALCALLILFIALLVKRDALIMCYRSAIFLVILGCLLTPFMSDGFTYPNAIIVGGYISFQIVAFALSGTFVKKLGISPLRCLCAGFGALYIGETCGLLTCLIVSTFFPLSTMTVFVIAILLAACLLFSCLFLLSERDFIDFSFSLPTTKDANKPSRATGVPLSPEETQIMFAEEFGLTNRELEVFGLVAQGRSNARIQEELYISAGTVSTHINHIYRKCGVSNKQDLLDIIQERQGIYK
jgi:DNA-binding CsgD family transcriptional regulator